MFLNTFFIVLEIIGTIAFAVSGAMKGIRKGMDLFGVVILGLITGVGGGIVRDAIIGNTPVVALKTPTFTILAIITSLVVFTVIRLLWKRIKNSVKDYDKNVIFFADTLGLAVFTMNGINIATQFQVSHFLAVVSLGVITGVGGGVFRDVFCGEVPDIFKKHVYAVAAAAGGCVYIPLSNVMPQTVAALIGIAVVVILRILAAHFRWNLPKINPETL